MDVTFAANTLTLRVRDLEAKSKRATFDKFARLFERVVDLTPVDTGELRANFDARYGLAQSKGYIQGSKGSVLPRPSFGLTFDEKSTDPLVLGSAVPYVMAIEYGSWSAKAPYGMINIAINEVYGV